LSAVPLLFLTLYFSTLHLAGVTTRRLRRKKVGLLIAHPDDEAMFFAPTLLQLTQPSWENEVYILCLSNGGILLLSQTTIIP
jgi:N-acetylglucosaminylphosphatidylinositol deacetylase